MKEEFDFKCPCNCGMDMRENDYEKFHRASDEEVEYPKHNTQEIQEWEKEFDYEFPDERGIFEGGDPYGARRRALKSFIFQKLKEQKSEIWKDINGYFGGQILACPNDFFGDAVAKMLDRQKEELLKIVNRYDDNKESLSE